MRRDEEPWVIGDGTGKRAAAVAEELALDEIVRQRGAVDRHERSPRASAVGVNGARDQLLAGPGLSDDQDWSVAACRSSATIEHPLHARRSADDLLEAVSRRNEAIEVMDAVAQIRCLEDARDFLPYDFVGVRDGNEVLSPATDRFGGVFDGGAHAEDYDGEVGPLLFDRLQDVKRGRVRAAFADENQSHALCTLDRAQDGNARPGADLRRVFAQQTRQRVVQLGIVRGNEDTSDGSRARGHRTHRTEV